MRVNLAIAATAIVAAFGALAEPQWQHVGSLGMRHIVIVGAADSSNPDLLKKAAEDTCGGPAKPCVVAFWSDASAAPNAMPMTQAQQKAMVAQYVRNPASGKTELVLKCTSDSPPADTKCLR